MRYCLGPLAGWVGGELENYALAPPAEIEEATLCLLLGARGTPPQIACVARYREGRKRSELIQKFGGTMTAVDGVQVFAGPERSYVFGKETDAEGRPLLMASAPTLLQSDLVDATRLAGLTAEPLRQLLERTDRSRHLTVLFQPLDLRNREEDLTPLPLRPLLGHLLDFFGENAEAVCFSLHLPADDFVSELRVRTSPTRTPADLLAELSRRLTALPPALSELIGKMNPPELGHRKLIGRFPTMMQAVAAETVGGIDDRLVVLQTRLPERAGPNLALAGLLAWDESTRTDFTKSTTASAAGTPATANTVAERLKKPIEIDFRREPLEPAFTYIGGETGVTIEVDGDALKLAGYTKNMPQTFQLGVVPAEQAIASILKQYDKMGVVIDETNNKVIVTTLAAAKDRGQQPAAFPPAP